MSKTFWDEATYNEVEKRVQSLTPESKPLWGKFNSSQMLSHCALVIGMSLGDVPTKFKSSFLCFTPIKKLIIYVVPFPKGAPTAPELLPAQSCDFQQSQADLLKAMAKLRARRNGPFEIHAAFGELSLADWGALSYKHLDHHLRQFGA